MSCSHEAGATAGVSSRNGTAAGVVAHAPAAHFEGKRRYTPKELSLIQERLAQGAYAKVVALEMGRSENAIKALAKRLRFSRGRNGKTHRITLQLDYYMVVRLQEMAVERKTSVSACARSIIGRAFSQ